MHIRATTTDDLPALHAVFLESIAGVFRPHGFEPPAPPLEVFAAQQAHIVETGGGLCHVADDGDGPTGFASAWARGDDWFLASLFVSERAQGRGVGAALLAAAGCGAYARHRTITDAIQPVSNALYARRGLVPATPVLTFRGVPELEPPAGLEEGEGDLGPLDAVAYGFDRAVDHAYWAGVGTRTVWLSGGAPAGYSYAFGSGHIGPVAGRTPELAAAVLAAELARAEGDVRIRVPGSAPGLVEVALRAGLRLGPVPGLLLLSRGARPPDALAIGGYTLY